jgi:repressor LexA
MEECATNIEAVETIQDRLKQVFDSLGMTIYQISKDLGENPSKFYNILSGRAKPSYDTIMSLLACYPQIRADYLLRGILPVLGDSEREGNSRFAIADENLVEVPFVPIKFYASFVETYTEGFRKNDMDTYRVRSASIRSNRPVVVIEVSGNSMTPQLSNGAKVLAEQVDQSNWEYQSGGIFAVMYRDFFVVKRIKDNELLTKKYLTLHSDNALGGSVTVSAKDLRGIWRIVSIVDSPVE